MSGLPLSVLCSYSKVGKLDFLSLSSLALYLGFFFQFSVFDHFQQSKTDGEGLVNLTTLICDTADVTASRHNGLLIFEVCQAPVEREVPLLIPEAYECCENI